MLKLLGKHKTEGFTDHIVRQNLQESKFKNLSALFGHLAFLCEVFIGTSCKLCAVTEGTREGSSGRWGQQQPAPPPVSTGFDLM